MYGYLKCFVPTMSKEEQRLIKRYYCSNCLAIKKSYGFFSTIILSNDLTIVPIVLEIVDKTVLEFKKCHYRTNKSKLDSNLWKPIAALNLAITEQKIIDSLEDEKKFIKKLTYKMLYFILKKNLKKAKKDYPNIFLKAKEGMQNTIKIEKANGDIFEQSLAFKDMIISSLCEVCDLTQDKKNFIEGLSTWLCLIDAIDDLDKDIKEGVYNPLIYTKSLNTESKKILINNSYFEIMKIYNKIYNQLKKFENKSNYQMINYAIKIYILKIIPYQTKKILKKEC